MFIYQSSEVFYIGEIFQQYSKVSQFIVPRIVIKRNDRDSIAPLVVEILNIMVNNHYFAWISIIKYPNVFYID